MRISISLEGESKGSIKVPANYRSAFTSLIKKAFTYETIYDKIYCKKRIRPFTFGVWLGRELKWEDEKMECKPPFKMVFSTNDYEVFTHFYNGVLEMKNRAETIRIGNDNLRIKDILLEKVIKITSNKAMFKTLGIAILTDPDASAKDFEKWFVTPQSHKFEEVLNKRIKDKYKKVLGKDYEGEVKFYPLTQNEFSLVKKFVPVKSWKEANLKVVRVKHYDGYIKGFRGFFWLEAAPKILQFVYDYGLGVRTGQGFGCLELITQI